MIEIIIIICLIIYLLSVTSAAIIIYCNNNKVKNSDFIVGSIIAGDVFIILLGIVTMLVCAGEL